MARGPYYNVSFRRRREGKTNYELRRGLISSGLARLVARKTRNHVIVQLVRAAVDADIIVASAHSSELKKKYGWLGNLDNLSASYLTGLICGYRSLDKGVNKAVLDIGLQTPSRGSRVFAALKGFLDAGVEIAHNDEILPNEDRIRGQHVANYAAEISSDAETYSRMFSAYLSRGLTPEKIPDHFSSVKEKIAADFRRSSERQ